MTYETITELPFEFSGKILRCCMPFGIYDKERDTFHGLQARSVNTIVLLASDEECLKKAERNLRAFYKAEGIDVIYLPIEDYSIPKTDLLESAVNKVLDRARQGNNIAIHCSASIGRTGLVATCLYKQVYKCSGDEAIEWVRRFITGAVETPEQKAFVCSF